MENVVDSINALTRWMIALSSTLFGLVVFGGPALDVFGASVPKGFVAIISQFVFIGASAHLVRLLVILHERAKKADKADHVGLTHNTSLFNFCAELAGNAGAAVSLLPASLLWLAWGAGWATSILVAYDADLPLRTAEALWAVSFVLLIAARRTAGKILQVVTQNPTVFRWKARSADALTFVGSLALIVLYLMGAHA